MHTCRVTGRRDRGKGLSWQARRSRRATRAPLAMAAPTRGVLRERDGDAIAFAETSRDSKRRRIVAFHATVARVVGRADPEVDRTPFGEPPRCDGCGLHCLGRRYACVRCDADAFRLCVVCFSAHVRMSAPDEPEATPENTSGRPPPKTTTSPSTSSPSSFPDGDIRRDVADILRAAREQVAAARAARECDEDEDEDGDRDDALEDEDGDGDGDDALEETRDDSQSDGERDWFAKEDDAAGTGRIDASFAGIHVHPPEDFRREGDCDQEAMDETIRERRAFAEERERDAAEAAESADVERDDGASRVFVVDTGDAGASDSRKGLDVSRGETSTWDYASEII